MNQGDELVFLSIHEKWAEKILHGEKLYEYRRVAPNRSTPYTILLYATNGTSAVLGEAEVDRTIEADIDNLLARTLDDTPHSISEIKEYFEGNEVGHALHIDDVNRYAKPISLDKIKEIVPDFSPPQNFIYLKSSEYSDLLRMLPTYVESTPQQQLIQFEEDQ